MTELELLQKISHQLTDMRNMQHDFIHNARILGFVASGVCIGIISAYVLMREALKKW